MAALSVALPIIAAALPIVEPWLQSIFIHFQHTLNKGGDPQNTVKFNTSVQMLKPLLDTLATAGIIPGGATEQEIQAIVQAAFTTAKLAGKIPDVVTAIQPAQAVDTSNTYSNTPSNGLSASLPITLDSRTLRVSGTLVIGQ